MALTSIDNLIIRLCLIEVNDGQFHIVLVSFLKEPPLEFVTVSIGIGIEFLLQSLLVVANRQIVDKNGEVCCCDILYFLLNKNRFLFLGLQNEKEDPKANKSHPQPSLPHIHYMGLLCFIERQLRP